MREIWVQVILHADARPKRNHKKKEVAGSSTRTVLIGERMWTDVEGGDYSFSEYAVSKKINSSS